MILTLAVAAAEYGTPSTDELLMLWAAGETSQALLGEPWRRSYGNDLWQLGIVWKRWNIREDCDPSRLLGCRETFTYAIEKLLTVLRLRYLGESARCQAWVLHERIDVSDRRRPALVWLLLAITRVGGVLSREEFFEL